MAQAQFKLVGLSAPKSFTLMHNNDHFWATTNMPDDRYKALFRYFKDSEESAWTGNERGLFEYTKQSDDGTPIEGIVLEVILP